MLTLVTNLKNTIAIAIRNSKLMAATIRKHSVWTQERIIKAPYNDIQIPNCTLYEYMWQNLDKWHQRTASICALTGRRYSYENIYKLSKTFAANLRKKFKICDGDTVAIMLPNIPEYPIIALGILQAGGIITNIHSIFTTHEIQRCLMMSSAKTIVTEPKMVPYLNEALKMAKLNIPVIVAKTNGDQAPNGTALFNELSEDVLVDRTCLKEVRRNANDICFLAYSSGTTGEPKAVELAHKNFIANFEQNNEPQIRCHNETTGTHQDNYICVRPFSHIYGASVLMFHKLSIGAKLVVLDLYVENMHNCLLKTLTKQKINIVMVPSSFVISMSINPMATPKIFENVELLVYGGAPLDTSDVDRFRGKAGKKIDIKQSYGLTETSPVVALSPKGFDCNVQIGPPLPNTWLRIVNQDLKNLGPNETGEVLVRGPQVMRGYKNNHQANKETFTADGWLRTGDIGKVDQHGILTITDRIKEIIKVIGYPVSSAELESLFRQHPSVMDAGVVGVPHPTTGQVPKAFVVIKPAQKCNEKELKEYIKQKVNKYKQPEDIMFVDSIPRNAAGKIMRRTLIEKYC